MSNTISVKPLKKFGQNYLQDKNILIKIANEFNPIAGENIIEIGPGTGNLTEILFSRVEELTGVEVDTRVADELEQRFPGLTLIRENILKTDFESLRKHKTKPVRVIGNIPYYLTSPILFHLLTYKETVSDAVLLMQLEVAERLISVPGSKSYGILSAIFNAFSDITLCFKVSPNVFYPKPKVYSAVIHINFIKKYEIENEDLYIKTVKGVFGTRRKTIKNALKNSIFRETNFSNCPIDLKQRAEQLTIPELIRLSNFLSSSPKK